MSRVKREFDQYLHMLYLMHLGYTSMAEMCEVLGCHRSQGNFLMNLLRDRYDVKYEEVINLRNVTYHLQDPGIFDIEKTVAFVERKLKKNPTNIRKD